MNPHEQPNPFKMAAQIEKSGALADVLERAGCTAAEALELSDEAWRNATDMANAVRPDAAAKFGYPSKETKALTIQRLEERERLAQMSDPFAELFGSEAAS